MKKFILVLTIFISSYASQAQFTSANLTAAGLTCAMCTKAIYNALGKIPGVAKVDTDIKNSSFIISFNAGSQVNPDQLKAAVQDAGFSVSKFQLTGTFPDVKLAKDTHITIGNKTFHFLNGTNTQLEGRHTITIVDKDYLSNKEFKKYAAYTTLACVQTGIAANCCDKFGVAKNERIYHVTL